MRRMLDANYKNENPNKFMIKQCQHLYNKEQERIQHFCRNPKIYLMVRWVRGIPLR